MLITRKSMFSGITRQRDIPVTQEQLDAWNSGELIQKVMPHVSSDDREFLMTGITSEEWETAFGAEEWETAFGEGND